MTVAADTGEWSGVLHTASLCHMSTQLIIYSQKTQILEVLILEVHHYSDCTKLHKQWLSLKEICF